MTLAFILLSISRFAFNVMVRTWMVVALAQTTWSICRLLSLAAPSKQGAPSFRASLAQPSPLPLPACAYATAPHNDRSHGAS